MSLVCDRKFYQNEFNISTAENPKHQFSVGERESSFHLCRPYFDICSDRSTNIFSLLIRSSKARKRSQNMSPSEARQHRWVENTFYILVDISRQGNRRPVNKIFKMLEILCVIYNFLKIYASRKGLLFMGLWRSRRLNRVRFTLKGNAGSSLLNGRINSTTV